MGVFNASDGITAEEFAELSRASSARRMVSILDLIFGDDRGAATTGGAALKRLTADAAQR